MESFSSDAGINVMVINVQAFNATGKDARRIYEELDDFQSRRPIDVISANRPVMFLDEPQKMEGGKTLDSLANFKPLAVLRYSATHKTAHNKIHRLDALDAYNQKLVKKIRVRGISVKGPDWHQCIPVFGVHRGFHRSARGAGGAGNQAEQWHQACAAQAVPQ
ncbi:hypothetical protein [Candidatus Aalborgicola defluviihabitans]|uniref:hypothetical protein n=1 Tax=Candidatus Aalborgicola defluviihabitans TaxID=3386187 RepID=UPI0039B8DE5D